MPKSNSYGFWLDAIPGLLGLFGIGELYLGKKRRGELFGKIQAAKALEPLWNLEKVNDVSKLFSALIVE